MTSGELDLIVIGAGSAGSAVAAFASADKNLSVLLVEAGPDYPDSSELPDDLADGNGLSLTDHDWRLRYRPSPEGQGGQAYTRGKVIGGSSAVNTCIALRGDRADYEEWAEIAGDAWRWSECLPYFIDLESDQDFGEVAHHGGSGPLPVRRHRPEEWVHVQAAVVEACRKRGYEERADFNDPDPAISSGTGAFPMNKLVDPLPSRVGRRVSSATAFLTPEVRARPNLMIRPNSSVKRVVVDSGQVTGIEIAQGRNTEFIRCRNVVVSAGTVMTPAILVRSGIGPEATLTNLSIPVASARDGVGRIYDHPVCIVLFKAKPGVVTPGEPIVQTTLRWTSSLMRDEGEREANDMQLEPVSYIPGAGEAFVAVNAIVERSFSQGWVKVVSAEASAHPVVETEMLSDERDLERMLEGVRLVMELARGSEFADVATELYYPKEEDIFSSDSDAKTWMRSHVMTGYHPAGTARMGASADDPNAVVDQYGRVFGVNGLRVADASIMPMIIRCNLNLTSMMIGMRMGDWIREELAS